MGVSSIGMENLISVRGGGGGVGGWGGGGHSIVSDVFVYGSL